MSSLRSVSLALLLFIAVGLLALHGLTPVVAEQQPGDTEDWSVNENASILVELDGDGDADWTISTTIQLEDDNDTEAFREVADDFEGGQAAPLGLESFELAAELVNQHTDRRIEITNVSKSTATESEVDDGVGRLSLEFTWMNFARTDGNQLFIDDVLVTESGETWFDGLYETQSLTIAAPPEYGVRDANVGAQNGKLRWEGPQTFDETSLQANFIGPGGTNGNGNNGPATGITALNPLLIGVIPLMALAILAAAFVARKKSLRIELPSFSTPTEPGDDQGTGSVTDQTESGAPDRADEDRPPTDVDGTSMAGSASTAEEEIDVELLSDEERVERLLSSNGGRMKQADIVKETDWSNAKVSQLLSSMEEEGQIDKLRIGRENLISFPEEEIGEFDE